MHVLPTKGAQILCHHTGLGPNIVPTFGVQVLAKGVTMLLLSPVEFLLAPYTLGLPLGWMVLDSLV